MAADPKREGLLTPFATLPPFMVLTPFMIQRACQRLEKPGRRYAEYRSGSAPAWGRRGVGSCIASERSLADSNPPRRPIDRTADKAAPRRGA